MHATRTLALAATAAALALGMLAPAATAADGGGDPFYVALNGQGRARVVVHQAEIPTWFGKVDVVQAPQANDASTGRITRVSLCDGASYVPPKIQGTSIFSAGKRNTLDSEMFQYSSEAKAAAAFAKLRADLYAHCRTGSYTGSTFSGQTTYNYEQAPVALPSLYGGSGVAVFTSAIGTGDEQEPYWGYQAFRVVGRAILAVGFVHDLPGSAKAPSTSAPVSATSTVEVLINRMAARYQKAALQSL